MCKRDDTVPMVLPRRPLSDPFGEHAAYAIDRCIAPIIATLNTAGVTTIACCCGHGNRAGWIALGDGRQLTISANRGEYDALHEPFAPARRTEQ